MLIRMRTIYAGPRGCCSRGKLIDLPMGEAKNLIKDRYAEPVKGKVEERAVNEPVAETAEAGPVDTDAAAELDKAPKPRRGRPPKR